MALRAKLYFERHIIFEISRSEISKMMCLSKQYSAAYGGEILYLNRGCVKSIFMALRAKLYLDRGIFSLILRSKIREKMPLSKEYYAAAGGKRLFIQPHPEVV